MKWVKMLGEDVQLVGMYTHSQHPANTTVTSWLSLHQGSFNACPLLPRLNMEHLHFFIGVALRNSKGSGIARPGLLDFMLQLGGLEDECAREKGQNAS